MSVMTNTAIPRLNSILLTPAYASGKPCCILVASVGEKEEAISHTHGQGFTLDAKALKQRLNITAHYEHIAGLGLIRGRIERVRPDIAILMPTWRDKPEAVVAAFRALHELPNRPRLVYLDWFAPTSSPHFTVLPYVDRYLKRNILVDFAGYRKDYIGGYEVAEFVSNLLQIDLGTWRFGSEIPIGEEHKVWLGWNFGVGQTYRRLTRFGRILGRSWTLRNVDVNRRLGPPSKSNAPNEWYQNYRDAALKALDPLSQHWRCSGYERIPRRRYLLELLRSKVVFSPFGWGEVCFRDYEAVACGALLVKPAMEHLITSPNIYVNNETYVSVKWDLSDAVEKITDCLKNPDRAKKIARNAQDFLSSYYTGHAFTDDIARALRGLCPE